MQCPTPTNHQFYHSTSETDTLLPSNGGENQQSFPSKEENQHGISSRYKSKMGLLLTAVCAVIASCGFFLRNNPDDSSLMMTQESLTGTQSFLPPHVQQLLGKSKKKRRKYRPHHRHKYDTTFLSRWQPAAPKHRCEWVMKRFRERDEGTPPLDLEKRYVAQSADPNVFYRATANLFWQDFAGFATHSFAHNFTHTFLLHNDPDSEDSEQQVDDDPENRQELNGAILTEKSVWTWVTGDQHLSNFGAWRNRDGEVVFGVNDFDEAAIYDFQIDVLRIAVSICSHAITNGLDKDDVDDALLVFTESYIHTVLKYEDNEDALLFELTPETSSGVLQDFLSKTERKKSSEKQMTKFTTRDPTTNKRHFIKGPIDVPHEDTNLASVPPDMVAQIKQAFNKTHYGATMMKLGWAVTQWDDKFFTVLDVAERVGSGIGSYGVDRYYVLLKGRDGLLTDDGEDGSAVILDVKYQPPSAVSRVLNKEDAAWYNVLFPNEAARVVEAQRRLTSYTDPFTGWVVLRNLDPNDTTYGQDQPFSVRQRSPWKDSPDLDGLTDPDDFNEFVAQIGVSTATSHVRGSVAKAPGDFKRVIGAVLGGSEHKRLEWGKIVAKAAKAYREQVLLDFECFRDYVQEHYGSPPPST